MLKPSIENIISTSAILRRWAVAIFFETRRLSAATTGRGDEAKRRETMQEVAPWIALWNGARTGPLKQNRRMLL
jgi:hypothetical protein